MADLANSTADAELPDLQRRPSQQAQQPPLPRQRAHVVAEDSGASFVPHAAQAAFFDESAGLLHLVEGRMVTAVALPCSSHSRGHNHKAPPGSPPPLSALPADRGTPGAASALLPRPPAPPSPSPPPHRRSVSVASDTSAASVGSVTARAFLVAEGPPVIAVRCSPDATFTALQRSARQVEFVDHRTGNIFVEAPQRRDAALHGFFWTDTPGAEFVMVTTQGMELFSPPELPSRQSLLPRSAQRLASVQWCVWHHGTRVLLLGCGPAGARVQAFQFHRSGGVRRLPLLDLNPPWGSPVKRRSQAPWLLVCAGQVWVVELYGRIFAAHHDQTAGVLQLYRLYRDATALQHEVEAKADRVELSVVDNVLLVHDLGQGRVALVDIAAGGGATGCATLCPPLPVGAADAPLLGATAAAAVELSDMRQGGDDAMLPVSSSASVAEVAQAAEACASAGGDSIAQFELHSPDWLVDSAAGRLLRLKLDLSAIAEACRDDSAAALLAFLQRRRPSSVLRRDPRHATLCTLRHLLGQCAPPPTLRAAFDTVLAAYAEAQRLAAHIDAASASHTAIAGSSSGSASSLRLEDFYPVVAPEEVALAVLAPLRPLGARGAVPEAAQSKVLQYLRAALAEFAAACHAHALRFPPAAAELYINVLLDQGCAHQVAPLLDLHAPLLDSRQLATALQSLGSWPAPALAGGQQLALDMWRRLGDRDSVCAALLQEGRFVAALREAARRPVGAMTPAERLEAAAASGDALLFAAAYRVCSQSAEPPLPSLKELALRHAAHFPPRGLDALLSKAPAAARQ